MNLKAIFMGAAACALLSGAAYAQSTAPAGTPTPPPPPKHHHHVAASSSTGSDRLDLLEKRVEQQAAEIDALKAQVAGQGSGVSSAQFESLQNQVYETQAAVKAASANSPVTWKRGRPTISSSDGKYTFSPRVDVMGDWGIYSKQVVAGVDLKQTGENFRRAQIGFQGTFAGDFGYKFLYDFGGTNGDETYQAYYTNTATPPKLGSTGAGSGPHIKEAWVSYKGFLDPFTFIVGAIPPPANLSDATASDDLLFNERPSSAQLSRGLAGDDGRDSVGLEGVGSIWNVSAFLTGDTYAKGALIAPSTSQAGLVSRAVVAPIQDTSNNFNIHLGGNYSYVFQPQESTTNAGVTTTAITFSDRPELRVDNVTFLNTGAINARSAYAAGVEGGVSWGPLLVQGEDFWYGVSRLNAPAGVTNPNFSGWYVEGSWVITGQWRTYNMTEGAFNRPYPDAPFNPGAGNWGAWELAGRYSEADLDYDIHSKVSGEPVFGGDQTIWSAGLNFYPTDNLKFMFDYQNVKVENVTKLNNNGTYDTFEIRTQVTF